MEVHGTHDRSYPRLRLNKSREIVPSLGPTAATKRKGLEQAKAKREQPQASASSSSPLTEKNTQWRHLA